MQNTITPALRSQAGNVKLCNSCSVVPEVADISSTLQPLPSYQGWVGVAHPETGRFPTHDLSFFSSGKSMAPIHEYYWVNVTA